MSESAPRHYPREPAELCPECGGRVQRGRIWHTKGCSHIHLPKPTPRVNTPEHEAAMRELLANPYEDIDEPSAATEIATPYD